jgi:hypothetical protein
MPEGIDQKSSLEWRTRQYMLDSAGRDPKALRTFDPMTLVESSELEACLMNDASLL